MAKTAYQRDLPRHVASHILRFSAAQLAPIAWFAPIAQLVRLKPDIVCLNFPKENLCYIGTAKSDDSYSFPLFLGNPKDFLTCVSGRLN